MCPHAFGQVRVRAWDVDRHGPHGAVDAFDCVEALLVELTVHERRQVVTHLEQLGRAEAPCLVTAHQERVLERRLDTAVDEVEAVVFAETHFGNAAVAHGRALQSPRREPFVLRAEWNVCLESGQRYRAQHVTRVE